MHYVVIIGGQQLPLPHPNPRLQESREELEMIRTWKLGEISIQS